MSTPVKPQVDDFNAFQTGDKVTTTRRVETGVEKPYAKDATSNVPARDGHTVETTQTSSGGAGGMSGKIERPYAEDQRHGSTTTSTTVDAVKGAAQGAKDAVKNQASDNLKTQDEKHHYA